MKLKYIPEIEYLLEELPENLPKNMTVLDVELSKEKYEMVLNGEAQFIQGEFIEEPIFKGNMQDLFKMILELKKK